MARRRLEAAIQAGRDIGEGEQAVIQETTDKKSCFKNVSLVSEVPFKYDRDGVFSLQFSLDGDFLAVGYGNGGIEILNSNTGESAGGIRHSKYGGLPVNCLRFHPKEHHMFLAGTSEGLVYLCNSQECNFQEFILEKDNEINCLDFSLDGFNFATGGKDLDVRIYDTATGSEIRTYRGYHKDTPPSTVIEGHACRIFALKYHPENNNIFITGGWDNHLKIWDARSNDGVKRTIHGPHVCGDSLDIKDRKILTGSWAANHALQIWDYDGGDPKDVSFPNHDGAFLYCAQFCDNNTVLAGGSGTKSVQAINTETDECIGCIQMTGSVQAMDTTRGGRLFAVGGTDKCIKIAKLC